MVQDSIKLFMLAQHEIIMLTDMQLKSFSLLRLNKKKKKKKTAGLALIFHIAEVK